MRNHFAARVVERLHPRFGTLDPTTLEAEVAAAITAQSPNVTFIRRVSRDGKRIWRYTMDDGRHFYVMALHEDSGVTPMTVLLPGMTVNSQGKNRLKLP
jgi:hypothetical protein